MFKHHRYPSIIIKQAVYFKLRFTLSYRDVEELLAIRGVKVDHSTIQRWVFKFSKEIEYNMNQRKKQVTNSWRLDETYIKVSGKDRFLYRAVDKQGNTIDFLLTKRRMKGSAQKFLNKAIRNNGKPRIINIDKSGANTAGIKTWNKRSFTRKKIKIRRVKYLNNIIEQDHRSNKEFLETNYPRGRAIEVFRSFHFDLSVQKSKFCYLDSRFHFDLLRLRSAQVAQ